MSDTAVIDAPAASEEERLTCGLMLERTQISYRQLDYWTTRGWLRAIQRRENAGSGIPRQWQPGEDNVGRVMNVLVHGIGMPPDRASDLARDLIAEGQARVAQGVYLTVPDLEELISSTLPEETP